jgi:hypothetical protein
MADERGIRYLRFGIPSEKQHLNPSMKSRTRTASIRIIGLLFIAGCAQVPKESVELSATVGRDIAELHEVHRETARLLFRQMRDDVNQFVDEVYRPYIISSQMEDQQLRANSDLATVFRTDD